MQRFRDCDFLGHCHTSQISGLRLFGTIYGFSNFGTFFRDFAYLPSKHVIQFEIISDCLYMEYF